MRWSIFLVALSLVAHFAPRQARAEERLNVVLILIDDLGQRDLGCYGSTYYKTPHLDKLAKEGTRFTDAYAACPVCSPTRASILTGKYPARLHLTDWLPGRADRPDQKMARPSIRQELPLEENTLAEAFKSAGYATAHVGKWHLGGKGFEPQKQGFDVNIAGDHTGTPRSYFAPFGKGANVMNGLEDAPKGEYLTDRLTTEAERFIEQNRQKPFFLYLAHYAVHTPLNAKPDVQAKYKGEMKLGSQSNPIYAAMIESMDDSVGRVMKKLDELKLSDRTIVLFTSDNGGLCTIEGPNTPATINSPLREGKGHLYEGGIRVPLIVRGPGVVAGASPSVPVCSIDFFPTLLELCGIKAEAKIDGISFAPVLKDAKASLPREALYWHYPHYSNQVSKPGAAIRAGEWKLIEFYEDGRRELFNVGKNAGEGQNMIADQPAIAKELGDKLDAWRKEVGAQMMTENPNYTPGPQDKQGVITLHARHASVHGIMLRYEPLPHKDTLGYWVRADDWASFEFTVTTPGKFEIEALQGCGKGSGGSEVNFGVGEQVVKMVVEDTGHFQNFKPRVIGQITIEKAGRYTLTVKPQKKPGVAVMDLRAVTLKPVK